MKTITLNISVEKPFGNLYRKECVLVAVFDHNNRLLLGEKPSFYPPYIARLLGGGVDQGEASDEAALRELAEELNVTVKREDLKVVAAITVNATDSMGNSYTSTTYLYSVNIGDDKYEAGDDVKYISSYSQNELADLIETYKKLHGALWYKGAEGEFSWYDYAQVYSHIHEEVLNEWAKSE
jgi:8-oxo-dGTP pyrophosphatase MutT (NUDIX family)